MLLQQKKGKWKLQMWKHNFWRLYSFLQSPDFFSILKQLTIFWAFWIPFNSHESINRFLCITSYHRLRFFFLCFVSIFSWLHFTSLLHSECDCSFCLFAWSLFFKSICLIPKVILDTRPLFKVIPVVYYFSQMLKYHIGEKHFVHCMRQRNDRVLGICEYVI